MFHIGPIETEITYQYSQHQGPKSSAAGITIQILRNEGALIITSSEENQSSPYFEYAVRGLRQGLEERYGAESLAGQIEIVAILEHPIDSNPQAFEKCGRALVHSLQAFRAAERPKKPA